MVREKRQRQRIPKAERRNMRLWAEGARETILLPHIDGYTTAMDEGWHAERAYLKKVCNEFHARVDWRIPHHEEPTLKNFDPNAPLPKETLPDEEEAAKCAKVSEVNERIRRWFKYRIRNLRKHLLRTGEHPAKDPYVVLLGKLSGLKSPPKARQAYQQYMHESYKTVIKPLVDEKWAELRAEGKANLPKAPKAGFRAAVARDAFADLPEAEQIALGVRAKASAAEKKKEYLQGLKDGPSKAPQDRQKCIDRVADFAGPILRGIQEATGMHAVLLVGGPMPKLGGELRTIHVSYGRNNTAAATHFPQWDKPRFSENVIKFMLEYLATAFSAPEECSAAALPSASSVPDLGGANYTIAEHDHNDESDSGSDSDSDDSSSDGSSSDSDEQDSEDEEQHRQKRKVAAESTTKGKGKSVAKPAPPAATQPLTSGTTYNQTRADCYIPSQKGKERPPGSPDVDASPEHPEEDRRFSCRLFSQHHSSEG
ncbi:hypothetical protein B0H11DRAFT_2233350 [Mycena galericulata]|nr:hypothetical protein B0H11DRAFT_2233350 [Mycena galericulata]